MSILKTFFVNVSAGADSVLQVQASLRLLLVNCQEGFADTRAPASSRPARLCWWCFTPDPGDHPGITADSTSRSLTGGGVSARQLRLRSKQIHNKRPSTCELHNAFPRRWDERIVPLHPVDKKTDLFIIDLLMLQTTTRAARGYQERFVIGCLKWKTR